MPNAEMELEDVVDASVRSELRRMAIISRALHVLFIALAVLLAIVAIVLATFALLGSDSSLVANSTSALAELLSIAGFAAYSVALFFAGTIFKDIAAGEAPFTLKQAKRIRAIAWLLLAIALIEAGLPLGIIADNAIGTGVFGVANSVTYAPPIRIGSIIVAVVFFFLSSVFDYGVKLQEISNEMI